jgi:arylsulfatase A-like enzyme
MRAALIGVMVMAAWSVGQAQAKPNVVLVLADDLGYMDIGANHPGTFYQTPHIDSLARSGVRFTHGYAACPVCSPTRASIMTGKYPPRTGVTDYIGGNRPGRLLPAPNADHLRLEETTLAEALRDGGYATFFAGKWHLGTGPYEPSAQGFPAQTRSASQFYYPPTDSKHAPNDDPKTSDQIADSAVDFIAAHKDKPFFAYLPFLAVHTPVRARADLVAKYERLAAAAPPDAWLPERRRQARQVQNHPIYAAMLEQMDSAIGRVLAALRSHGLEERTVVIFTSDNGGLSTSEGSPTSNVPLRAGKGWLYEGGIRTPWIIRAPGVGAPGSVCPTPVITTDLYPTILELTGLPAMPAQHQDGVSLVPLLRGAAFDRGSPLFWHYPHYGNQGGAPGGAIRQGDWKLIEWYEDGSLELFDLASDVGEKTNLAASNPARTAELHTRLKAWRTQVKAVMPTPNPNPVDPEAPRKPANPPKKKPGKKTN